MSRRYSTLVVAAVSIVVLTCVAFLVPVPYSTMRPGPAFDTLGEYDGEPMFEIDSDVKTYPTDGSLDFTTVMVSRADSHMTLAEAMQAWFSPHTRVVPKSLVHPEGESQEDSEQIGAEQLSSSKDSSQVAALRAADYTVPEYAQAVSVSKDGAADGKLKAADKILAIDGTRAKTNSDVVDLVAEHDVGDKITVRIERDGDAQDVSVTIGADPDDPKKPRIGVTVGRGFDMPVKIANNVDERIGGPSAGMMFALSIYDRLVPASLTGGTKIAGTGEISPEGEIGSISGVQQKMAGAHKAGAEVFLVPEDNCKIASKGDDFGMRLVRVSTLKSAIDALEKLADNPKASIPTCQ